MGAEGPLILYIEDDPGSAVLAGKILRFAGYRVAEAEDGSTGLARAAELNPDLILLDIDLPDIDGYRVARELKNMKGLRGVPVLALTASALRGDRDRALEAGFDDYILKPINVHNFADLIRSYLDRKR